MINFVTIINKLFGVVADNLLNKIYLQITNE